MFGMQLNYDFPPVEHTFNAGEIIKFGHHELTVIECPGHTPGGVTFYCKDEKSGIYRRYSSSVVV